MSEDSKTLLQQWGPIIPVVLFLAAQGLIALKWASDQGATMRELTTFRASIAALDLPGRIPALEIQQRSDTARIENFSGQLVIAQTTTARMEERLVAQSAVLDRIERMLDEDRRTGARP